MSGYRTGIGRAPKLFNFSAEAKSMGDGSPFSLQLVAGDKVTCKWSDGTTSQFEASFDQWTPFTAVEISTGGAGDTITQCYVVIGVIY